MSYASQVGFSPNSLIKEQMQVSINKLQRSRSKVLTPEIEFNSTKVQFQQNEGEFFNRQYKKLKSLKIFEQKKEKLIQNSPLSFYLQDSKLQDDLGTPSQKVQLDQIQEKIQLDFSKFYKNDKTAAANLQQRHKRLINKQNLLEQIASFRLDNKIGFEQQKDSYRLRKPLQLQQLYPQNNSTNKYLNRVLSPFQNNFAQSPSQNKHQFQHASLQRLIPISQVQKKFISFKIRGDQTEKIDPANQIKLEKTNSFLEIKDKFFQISRLFQEKTDQELSNNESPMLKLLILKGYKPQNLCFYFSKLVENIVTNCSYPQEKSIFLNKQKKIITRKNSINLENQEDLEKTYQYNLCNQINNNTTNSSSSSKLTNNLTTNPSAEKDLNMHSAIYSNSKIFSNKAVSATKGVNTHKSKADESVMQIHSLVHISSNLIEEIQFITQPQIKPKDISQTAQQFNHSLDLEEIAYNEDENDQKDNLDYIQREAAKEKMFTDLEHQKPNFAQEKLPFNLFFKIPTQIYDEFIQILSQILRSSVQNTFEINYLIKYLNDHKKEYTPQNLAEEFGSIERIQDIAKFILNKLISESLLQNQFKDLYQEEEILNFVNSLLNSDFKQLKHYSSLLNMNTKLSFAEFYLFKQLIHKQLLDIFDKDERIYLLPQVMEKIEKSRQIFLIQREHQIFDDQSLIKKIQSEIKMKFYIACPLHIFESYFFEKMNNFSSNSVQTHQQNQNKSFNNSQQLFNHVQYLSNRYQKNQNRFILRDLHSQKEKQINNSAQQENLYDNDYLIFTPKNKNNIQNIQKGYFNTHKRFSFVNEVFNNSQKSQSDMPQSPKQDNHQNINKAIQICYYEDLTQFIMENILQQQNLTYLIEGLKLKLTKLDFQILNFLQSVFEEILTDNQVQSEIIYDIKVRFNKIKFSLIENFKIKYESEEFRQTLKNYFTSVFENNLKINNLQLSHTKFFSAFDYIVFYYLSLNDIFSSYDFHFALFISDNDEIVIQIFKNSVIETLKLVLPELIIDLIDLEKIFLQ
ncbi:hypothetical protein ABPG72_016729 [Tetrahymena utriculariae]